MSYKHVSGLVSFICNLVAVNGMKSGIMLYDKLFIFFARETSKVIFGEKAIKIYQINFECSFLSFYVKIDIFSDI